jgi:hypothetical protein
MIKKYVWICIINMVVNFGFDIALVNLELAIVTPMGVAPRLHLKAELTHRKLVGKGRTFTSQF